MKPAPAPKTVTKEVQVLPEKLVVRLANLLGKAAEIGGALTSIRDEIAQKLVVAKTAVRTAANGPPPAEKGMRTAHTLAPKPLPRREVQDGELKLNKTQQRIIDALAWYESLGNQEPTLTQIGAVALIDPTGGHFSNMVGPLSTAGLVTRKDGLVTPTQVLFPSGLA